MDPSIRVLGISKQTPHPQITPSHSQKLSFFDHFWHFIPPNQRLLFYSTEAHFPSLANKLREALSLALHHFYPLAGKLVWSLESDELEIQCGGDGDGDGGGAVLFIEAETDADFQHLVNDSIHDVIMYRKLLPPLDISELPAPLLSVQVTRFVAGGICLGISFHHMVMDGRAFWLFMKSWAEICKSGDLLLHPSHDRSVIRDTDGVSKVFLDGLRSHLPKVKYINKDPPQTVKRTFQLSYVDIQLLKERAGKQQTCSGSDPVSTFVAVSAYAWTCSVRAQRVTEKEITNFALLVDCRSHLDPPVVEEYFGNCVKLCIVQATGRELLGETGFGFAVTRIRREIRESVEEPVRDSKSWLSKCFGILSGTTMNVASSPRFRVYETDFGWGRPRRVESGSMNAEGQVVLDEKRDEEGGIQLSIALAPPYMDEFCVLFFHGLHGGTCVDVHT